MFILNDVIIFEILCYYYLFFKLKRNFNLNFEIY